MVRTKDIAGPLQVFATSRAETKAAVQARAGAEARLGREWRATWRVTVAAEAAGICD